MGKEHPVVAKQVSVLLLEVALGLAVAFPSPNPVGLARFGMKVVQPPTHKNAPGQKVILTWKAKNTIFGSCKDSKLTMEVKYEPLTVLNDFLHLFFVVKKI